MCEHTFEILNSFFNINEPFPFVSLSCFLSKRVEEIKPIKYYTNIKEDRKVLIRDLKEKTGVYCLVNLINGHIYIGSSINLAVRMRNYLNTTFLKNKRNKNMPIIQALLKYGQDNFAVLIVEFVEVEILPLRETHYITQLLPYYNVLKQGYSSLLFEVGYKHTEETKKILSELAKNRVHSLSTKVLISRALVGQNNPFYNKNHSLESKLRMIEANSKYSIYIYNSFRELLVIFPSVNTLAKLIHSNHSVIKNNIQNETLFRGEWYFSYLPFNLSDTPLISKWNSNDSKALILEMNKHSHIKKAIFAYNIKKEFIIKFEGVTHAQKELNINHDVIKKHALLNIPYKGYIFSYDRLKDELER